MTMGLSGFGLRLNAVWEKIEQFAQRMDDRVRLDDLILFIRAWFARLFDNDPKREPGTFATNNIP